MLNYLLKRLAAIVPTVFTPVSFSAVVPKPELVAAAVTFETIDASASDPKALE